MCRSGGTQVSLGESLQERTGRRSGGPAMPRPVLLAVDDDPEVLRAVERDLRRRYGAGYRVVRAESGESALQAVRQLKERGDPIALFLVDQRMPQMTGVAFLGEAMQLYPD